MKTPRLYEQYRRMLQANEDRRVLEEFVLRDGRASVKLEVDEGHSLDHGGDGCLELRSALEATLGSHQVDATSRYLQDTVSGSYNFRLNKFNSSTIVNVGKGEKIKNVDKLNATTSDTHFESGLSPKMSRPHRRASRHSKLRAAVNSESHKRVLI